MPGTAAGTVRFSTLMVRSATSSTDALRAFLPSITMLGFSIMPSSLTRGAGAGQITIDVERRQVTVRGQPVELTKQEFDVLYQLASRPGVVFPRAALLQKVWSDDTYVTERTVDTIVSRVRKKIEQDPHDPELILTAWGVGYKFADVG